MKNAPLKLKLVLFTLGVSLGSLLLAGYLVDRNLLDYHQSTAKKLVDEGFDRLDNRLMNLEADLLKEANFIRKEERFLAALNLINQFQDIHNYQAILFDEEKKRLARRLQTSVQSGLSTGAYIYAADHQLVAYVRQKEQGMQQGYVNYQGGKPRIYIDTTSEADDAQPLSDTAQAAVFKRSQSHHDMQLGQYYRKHEGQFFVEQKYPLFLSKKDKELRVGFLVLVRKLDLDFLLPISSSGIEGGLIAASGELLAGQPLIRSYYQQLAGKLEKGVSSSIQLLQSPAGFWGVRPVELASGRKEAYMVFLYPMVNYKAAQASTRKALAISLLLAALLVIPLSLWLVRQLVTQPLEHLSEGVEKIRKGDWLSPIKLHTQDELGRFAQAMNSMAIQLHQREENLQANNQELQRLSEIMAHHFQEPTRRLMIFSERLQKHAPDNLSADARTSLAFIQSQSQNLSNLVHDVQRYLELHKISLPAETVDTNQLLTSLLQEAGLQKKIAEADARIEIQPDLPWLYCPPRRLKEMLRSLLDNALTYRDKQRRLHIKITSKTLKNKHCIYVTDNGSGIKPQYRLQVLDLFTRLVSSQDAPGTGVGLALVRQLMKQLGGDVMIEDGLEGGTTFVLSFPYLRS